MQKTNTNTKAELEAQEALKKRAARQAHKRELMPTAFPKVTCTVLPMGADKISMGEHVPGLGEVHYEEGETFETTQDIAVALYRRGFVNFPDAREIVAGFATADQAQAERDRREKEYADRVLEGA